MWQDLRYALRALRRSPGFALAAVLSLALGIGANTAIFSLMDALLLRLLPVRDPGQLVEFLVHYPGDPPGNYFSWRSYQYYREHNHVFSGITTEGAARWHIQGDGLEPELVNTECVAGSFFPMLGVHAQIGRLLGPEDEDNTGVAVLSWSYWSSRFHRDPAILGRRITVEGVPLTIVGVAQRSFVGLRTGIEPNVWVPVAVQWRIKPDSRASSGGLGLIARMAPGVHIEQVRAEMAVLFRYTYDERNQQRQDAAIRQLAFTVEPAGSGLSTPLRQQFGQPLRALMALVGLLLLIACTNVASMLLARSAARGREMAIRISLGAGPWRLVRQVLTESMLLAGAGGILGIVLAWFGEAALVRIMTSGRFVGGPPHIDVALAPDVRVLLFTATVSLLTGLLFGMAPAWSALTSMPVTSLRDAGRAGESRGRRFFGRCLVASQVAFTVVLLSAAWWFVGRLASLERLDLGFRRDHILLVSLDAARSGLDRDRLRESYRELLARLEAIPGVQSATISAPTPLSGAGASRYAKVEGHPERPEDRRLTQLKWIAPKYFETVDHPLLYGRDFSPQDSGRPRVAIVNQSMALYYFGTVNPIGKYVGLDGDEHTYEIIGVTADERYYDIMEAPLRTVYLDALQADWAPSTFVLRTAIDPVALTPEVRRAVRQVLSTVTIEKITTLTDQVDATIVPQRLIAMLSGWFGALGVLLAAVGLYGLLAYTVNRRINEIGIRMALGATRGRVLRMMLKDAAAMVAAGLVMGVPVVLWAKSLAAPMMKELPGSWAPPVIFAVITLLAVGLAAAYLPARKASRVEPMEALRQE